MNNPYSCNDCESLKHPKVMLKPFVCSKFGRTLMFYRGFKEREYSIEPSTHCTKYLFFHRYRKIQNKLKKV